MSGFRLSFCVYVILILEVTASYGQETGILKGNVIDGITSEPLIGVNVFLVGTTFGISTDIEGNFVLTGIPPGNYALNASMLSYETAVVDVVVSAGHTTSISISLKESQTQLDEIVVVGDPVFGSSRLIHTDEMAIIDKIKDSELNITGISTQQIIRSVDNNAADLVKRAASVSVIDDFVTIRGLYERYNFTFINGMQAPSSKPDGRAFSFDLIPSGMIDNILIYRSPAPELPADFAGGVVDITTRQSLPEKQLELSASIHHRQGTTFENQHYTESGSNTDKFGFDDGSRGIPFGFPIDDLALIKPNRATLRERQLNGIAAQSLLQPYTVQVKDAKPDYRFGLNYYDSWRIGEVRLSSATSLNYTATTATRAQTFTNWIKVENFSIVPSEIYHDTITTTNFRIGGFQSINVRMNSNHSILLNAFVNQDGSDRLTVRSGYGEKTGDDSKDNWLTEYPHQVNYRYNSRTIVSGFLRGTHKLPTLKSELTWLGGYTYSYDNLPGERNLRYFSDSARTTYSIQLGNNGASISPSIFYREIKESIWTGRVDLKKTFLESLYLKTGLYAEDRSRDYFSRMYYWGGVQSAEMVLPATASYDFPIMYHADSLMNNWVREDGLGMSLIRVGTDIGGFASKTNLLAGYAGLNFPMLKKKLTVYTGVRYEYFQQAITPQNVDSTYSENKKQFYAPDTKTNNFLPSVNLTYSPKEKIKIRASYGITINRPHERELSGNGEYDYLLGYTLKGYPLLKQATIHNADARIETYGGVGEVIAFGVFYKKFINPIELTATELPDGERDILADEYQPSNTQSAINYGVELEFRKNLSFIHPKLEPFSIILNGSLISSTIQLADSLQVAYFENQYDQVRIYSYANAKGVKRSLTGTSPYLLNASIYYDNKKTNTTIAVQYNLFGPRIITPPVIKMDMGSVVLPDGSVVTQLREFFSPGIYEDKRQVLDITIRQKITKQLGFKFGIQNVLNSPTRLFADRDRDEKYTPATYTENVADQNKQDIERSVYYEGRYVTVGLSFIL